MPLQSIKTNFLNLSFLILPFLPGCSDKNSEVENYLPLDSNLRLRMEVLDFTGKKTGEFYTTFYSVYDSAAKEIKRSYNTFLAETDEKGTLTKGKISSEVRVLEDENFVYFELEKVVFALSQNETFYRFKFWKKGAKAGDFWYDEKLGTLHKVTTKETLVVPAGSFENCLKVEIVYPDSVVENYLKSYFLTDEEEVQARKFFSQKQVQWFAPNLGLVKYENGQIFQLKEYAYGN
ncbi:hypothetical protein IT568_10785 [bacterium]|nr:hypothetical protein [bacterium]